MRRWITCLVALLLLLPTQVLAADWTTRGGGEDRTQSSGDPFGAVVTAQPVWTEPLHLGATGSQPIVVGNKLYHLGGHSLWEIDLPTGAAKQLLSGLGFLADGTWRPSTSSIAYASVGGEPLLYFGSGSNALCVFNLQTKDTRCRRLHPDSVSEPRIPTPSTEAPIVSTPLVMTAVVDGRETDFVVVGDKQGRIWYFQGFGLLDQTNPYQFGYLEYGGWIVASMVEVSGNPLTFIAGSTDRWINAYKITPGRSGRAPTLTATWGSEIQTRGQIADGFAKGHGADGEEVFALDSVGNLLRIKSAMGRSSILHLENIKFTNTSPAIDDQHIYLSIRETTKGTGALVAVNRSTFQEAWRKELPHQANTNPLVLTGRSPSVVLIGDVKGNLYAYETKDGTPADLFQTKDGQPFDQIRPGNIELLGESYQTLTGLSETILASGSTGQPLLITGISGMINGKPDGYLIAYGTKPGFDASWGQVDPKAGTARISSTAPVQNLPVQIYFQPTVGPTTLLFDQSISLQNTTTINFKPPPGPGKLTGFINPGALVNKYPELLNSSTPPALTNPAETDLKNNRIELSLMNAPDLGLRIQSRGTYDCLGRNEVTVLFTNAGQTKARVEVAVRLGAKGLLEGVLDLAPGETAKFLPLIGIDCGESAPLTASVRYLDEALKEADLSNNQASTSITINEAPQMQASERKVIMVPADCQVNPDWSSNQPCLNYPDLIVN